jgi:hypothetical protein
VVLAKHFRARVALAHDGCAASRYEREGEDIMSTTVNEDELLRQLEIVARRIAGIRTPRNCAACLNRSTPLGRVAYAMTGSPTMKGGKPCGYRRMKRS